MQTFYQWLDHLAEERDRSIAPEILHGYDNEMYRRIRELARQVHDDQLRAQFEELLHCPLVDGKGRCRGFAEYIMAALLKNGIDSRYDLEQSLQYLFEKMLLAKSDSGEERTNLFTGFDPNRPGANEHLRARFSKFIQFGLNNIKKNKVRRLANVEPRPAGSVSIGQGRTRDDYTPGTISPEAIPARPSTDASFAELVNDITDLLKKREPAYNLPLAGVFSAMISGKNAEQQRKLFGDTAARMARPVILRIIGDYGQQTGNFQLLRLVDKYKDFKATEPGPTTRQPQRTVKPVLTPKEKDYASIINVIDRFNGQPVGSASLGSFRGRWYSYPSRTPGSTLNRLDDTLRQMVADNVLRTVAGSQGGVMYLPGPLYQQYRKGAAV